MVLFYCPLAKTWFSFTCPMHSGPQGTGVRRNERVGEQGVVRKEAGKEPLHSKRTSPQDRLISSFDLPAVCQRPGGCFPPPGFICLQDEGPVGQSITEHTWSAQRRQQVGRGRLSGGGSGWLGEPGPRLTGEDPTLRQDLRPLGVSVQGVYIIYQRGKGDRLGWSGLLTL